ncbi:hypothetical protein J1605_022076, partial [Eschrichtius robustus]
DHPPRPL